MKSPFAEEAGCFPAQGCAGFGGGLLCCEGNVLEEHSSSGKPCCGCDNSPPAAARLAAWSGTETMTSRAVGVSSPILWCPNSVMCRKLPKCKQGAISGRAGPALLPGHFGCFPLPPALPGHFSGIRLIRASYKALNGR